LIYLLHTMSLLRFSPSATTALALGAAFGAGAATASALSQARTQQEPERFLASSAAPGSPLTLPASAAAASCASRPSKGEISTHVISKLGKPSVANAAVRVHHHSDFGAGSMSPGWKLVREATLSQNGGVDDLVPPGQLSRGLCARRRLEAGHVVERTHSHHSHTPSSLTTQTARAGVMASVSVSLRLVYPPPHSCPLHLALARARQPQITSNSTSRESTARRGRSTAKTRPQAASHL
jgi:hypothetical protein